MTKIAACLIVKNSAPTLEACLDSIRPHVDEVNVYDTGSTDGTLELLERLGSARGHRRQRTAAVARRDARARRRGDPQAIPLAPIRVERGEWRDDFAWAREQSFAMVSDDVDWLLWLDDDDVDRGRRVAPAARATAPPQLDGYVFFYDYARDEHGRCVCQLWRERLLRRDAGYTWKGAIHEVLAPPDGQPAALAQVDPEQTRYVHNRPPDKFPQDRNLKILLRQKDEADAKGEPVDPRTLAYIGTELMAQQRFAEAVGYLDDYVKHPDAGWSDERAQVHHKLATCMRVLSNPHGAVEVEMQALRERDDWAETAVGLAAAFAQAGRWDRCERWARRALELGVPQTPLILNPLEFSLLPHLLLADAYVNLGRFDEARAVGRAGVPGGTVAGAAREGGRDRAVRVGGELVNGILHQREVLVRHDENEKAWRLLNDAVPYIVQEHPAIVRARAEQREMVAHLLRPDEYARWYRDEPKESTIGDEVVETSATTSSGPPTTSRASRSRSASSAGSRARSTSAATTRGWPATSGRPAGSSSTASS
jgi:glycosyltransferase involved in cell wall biosynthesis